MKYKYCYCVYKNNARDGVQFVQAFKKLSTALTVKASLQMNGGGCCDVVKKRFNPGAALPEVNSICNNIKYY